MPVRIYRPAKTAMQSGRANTRKWVLEHEPAAAKRADPLMGWLGSRDTTCQIRLKFATREEAVAYAKRNGLAYEVVAERDPAPKLKNYADKFAFDRAR